MSGLKMTTKTLDEMRAAQKRGEDQSDWDRVRTAGDYEWDGRDDEERPLSKEEMRAAIRYSAPPQHQANNHKVATTIHIDADVLEYFRATGKKWQNRISDVLKEYVASH